MTRKLPFLAAMSAALFFLSLLAEHRAFARYVGGTTLTTVTQPDIVCFGGTNKGSSSSATEVCLDWNGKWVPTTNNSQALGTSSLRWSDIETALINTGGGSTTFGAGSVSMPLAAGVSANVGTAGTGNAAGTGNSTAPSSFVITGGLSLAKTSVGTATGGGVGLGIYISTVIPYGSPYETLISSGGNIVLTATPAISTTTTLNGATAITDGTLLVLTSTAAQTITLQDNGTLSGSLLELGSSTRAISKNKTLTLMFQADLGEWIELAYGNN